MRRLLVLAVLAVSAVVVPHANALPVVDGPTVLPPTKPGKAHPALLVLLGATGTTTEQLRPVAAAAQAAAGGLRLWVALTTPGRIAGEQTYASAIAAARTAGFSGSDRAVVVAGFGDAAASATSLGETHDLAGTAAIGADEEATLQVLGELDRLVPVVDAVAGRTGDVLVLPAADRAALAGPSTGEALASLVRRQLGLESDLDARLAADALVSAVRTAVVAQGGAVCSSLQAHTADLAEEGLLAIANRADIDLVAPTPDGVAERDLGGFLYDKAELVDEGSTARVTTNSYVVDGTRAGAAEVMCKTKSRSAIAQAVYDDYRRVDSTPPTCAGFTEATIAAGLAVLSPAARARSGGVAVLPDQATSAGPQWVFSPLLLAPTDPTTGRWQVQSPSLVTQLSDTELNPEFAGNHYCKVLSPLRALELLLQDTVGANA